MALFKVTLLATTLGSLGAEPVSLTPQFEAEDREELDSKIQAWLESTSYKPVDGSEPQIVELDPDTGLTPEVAAVANLADELAATKAKLAEHVSGDYAKELDAANKLNLELTNTLNRVTSERDAALTQVGALEQKLADRDSEIATLKAQLASVAKPVASSGDGSTPTV
jgi:DNA repair exonuclease SbcCD ATPase subunit